MTAIITNKAKERRKMKKSLTHLASNKHALTPLPGTTIQKRVMKQNNRNLSNYLMIDTKTKILRTKCLIKSLLMMFLRRRAVNSQKMLVE